MSPRVMVVDDDAPTLEVMKYLLPRLGWEPVMAHDGLEALKMLEATSEEPPSLILLDVMMSPISGWEFIDRIREKEALRDIPVMLFTAKHIWPEEITDYEEDLVGVLEKPVLPQELKRALQRFS